MVTGKLQLIIPSLIISKRIAHNTYIFFTYLSLQLTLSYQLQLEIPLNTGFVYRCFLTSWMQQDRQTGAIIEQVTTICTSLHSQCFIKVSLETFVDLSVHMYNSFRSQINVIRHKVDMPLYHVTFTQQSHLFITFSIFKTIRKYRL